MADLFNFAWDKKKPDWLNQGIGRMMNEPQFDAKTGIAAQVGDKSPFSQEMQGYMSSAAADYGTKPDSQQTYMLAQQDMALDQNTAQMPDQISGGKGFDFGKLATALAASNSGPEPMKTIDTRPANAGQQIQPIQIYGGQPAGMSGAMQAITGGQRMGMAGAMDQEELRRLRGY